MAPASGGSLMTRARPTSVAFGGSPSSRSTPQPASSRPGSTSERRRKHMSKSATKARVGSLGRTAQELASRQELIEAANADARENWNDPQWRRDFAADLTE